MTALRHPDAIGGAAIAVLGLVTIAAALVTPDPGFGVVGPAVLPTIFGAVVLASGLALLVATLRAPATLVLEPLDGGTLARAALAIALYLAAFVPVGFILSSAVLVPALARILGSRALVRDAVVSALFVVAVYVLFVRLLTVDLPRGVLPL